MPGLKFQDSDFSLVNDSTFSSSNAFCLQHSSCRSALQQDKLCTAASPSFSSGSPSTNSDISTCLDVSCCISCTVPNYKHRCNNSLVRAATTHALSTRSWSPPSIDTSDGDDEVAGLHDYETAWSDIVENGTNGSNIPGSNTGFMPGSFFCDMTKDVAKGAPYFSAESPSFSSVASPLNKYLTSLTNDDCWNANYIYTSDEFRMFEFKVRRCTRGRSHDWTECPFSHPGEKARRRDPRRFHYSGTACPDFRKGNCKRGDACEFAHGVFECWLHPARYRTQPCKDGRSCTRRICFFAHTPEQLRLLPAASSPLRINGSYDLQSNSPLCQNAYFSGNCFNEDVLDENFTSGMLACTESFDESPRLHVGSPRVRRNHCIASPTSTLACMPHSPPSISPPLSPSSSSPASPLTWHGRALSPARPITATARSFSMLSPSRSNVPRVQALLAAAQADASSFNSLQHDSVPFSSGYANVSSCKFFSSAPASPSGISPLPSRKNMNDLVTALQQLDLKNPNQLWLQHAASPHASAPSPLSRTSDRQVSSVDKLYYLHEINEDDYKLQRVESGKELREKFYGKVAEAANQTDKDECPDIGWVNDLVLD